MDTAETKMKAAEEAKKAKEAELAAVNEEIEDLKQTIKTNKNQQILSKADGNVLTRTSEGNFNKRYTIDNNNSVSLNDNSDEIKQGDLAYALEQFQKVKPEAKRKWALVYRQLYLSSGDKVPSKTQITAYENIIEPWLKENKAA